MKKFIQIEVFQQCARDNFEHGEDIDSWADSGIIDTLKVDTFEQVLDCIKVYSSHSPYIFDNRLEVSQHETENGNVPTAKEYEAFKENRIILFNVTYSFYVTEIVETGLSNEELIKNFPQLENN